MKYDGNHFESFVRTKQKLKGRGGVGRSDKCCKYSSMPTWLAPYVKHCDSDTNV